MFSVLRQTARSASTSRTVHRVTGTTPRWAGASVRTLVTQKYTEDHELVKFDDQSGVGTVSITEYAQKSLGDVVFVELPSVGTEVKQGEQIGAVESVKAASDIFAPVSGVIEAINEDLTGQPGLLNKSPEDKGWLCKIKLANSAELEKLLTADAYKQHCES